jgi:hypothetical protein
VNDEDLLGYFEIHARTERALFHRDHVARLLELAGRESQPDMPEWITARIDAVEPLVKEARKRMKS